MWRSIGIAVLLWGSVDVASATEVTVRFTAPKYFLPKLRNLIAVDVDAPGPTQPKHQARGSVGGLDQAMKLDADRKVDLWLVPADGRPIRIARAWQPAEGPFPLDSRVGVIRVLGDGQPRARLVTATTYEDPGPEEKGHRPIQTAGDFRIDLIVVDGDYSLWVSPANGSKPRRIAEKIRVNAGKTVTVD